MFSARPDDRPGSRNPGRAAAELVDVVAAVSRARPLPSQAGCSSTSSCEPEDAIQLTAYFWEDRPTGLRLEVVDGALPDGLALPPQAEYGGFEAGRGALSLTWAVDPDEDAAAVDLTLRVIPVGGDGTEGEPLYVVVSEPASVRIEADGSGSDRSGSGVALVVGVAAVALGRRRRAG
jgi:hypothetical protein